MKTSWTERIRDIVRQLLFWSTPKQRRRSLFGGISIAPNQATARQLAESPSTIVIVNRGIPRTVVFQCPSGCGDILTINVDPESGNAWELRTDGETVTLLPSVWRTTGCRSHFILFKNRVWWCDGDESAAWPPELAREFRTRWIQPDEFL